MSNSATPWIVTCQAPLSIGLLRKSYGVSCHFLLQGIYLPRNQTCVSCIGRWILYCWFFTREALKHYRYTNKNFVSKDLTIQLDYSFILCKLINLLKYICSMDIFNNINQLAFRRKRNSIFFLVFLVSILIILKLIDWYY